MRKTTLSRRQFLGGAAAAAAALAIVPRSVLGGPGQAAPSDSFGGALIGCGGQGPGTFGGLGPNVRRLAECDVKWLDRADNQKIYTDFRRVMERKDIDVVAIATPPHWHALISIAAMQAGKDVAVREADDPHHRRGPRGGRGRAPLQAHLPGRHLRPLRRPGQRRRRDDPQDHAVGAPQGLQGRPYHQRRLQGPRLERHGQRRAAGGPEEPRLGHVLRPLAPAPYHPHRYGGTHRGYWDYEGGGLGDMGQHYLDGPNWTWGKDDTSPVEIETYAPPAHPECTGMWGWSELKYADGFTFVLISGEWGKGYDRLQGRAVTLSDLDAGQPPQGRGDARPAAVQRFSRRRSASAPWPAATPRRPSAPPRSCT